MTGSDRLALAFRRNVRERMEALGITQGDLCQRLGVTSSYISQMLSGHRRPGLDSLKNFAQALNIEPADLLREKNLSATR